MKLSELMTGQRVTIQVVWGEQKIEFFSEVLDKGDMNVIVTPYIHNNNPLELNIEPNSKVICNIYAEALTSRQRRSWRNVELHTIVRNGKTVYNITTSHFNHVSSHDDRRKHERVLIDKAAKVVENISSQEHDITIHDVSDIGISFYSTSEFTPSSHNLNIIFDDSVNNRKFKMKVNCNIVRNHTVGDRIFWGCRIASENKDFLLYSFLMRLMDKKL